MTTALAPAPITTFTAPDPYPGLPAFWEALDSWLWNLEAGKRAQKLMEDASEILWQPDDVDHIEALGFPLLKHWLNDPEAYARLHAKRAAGWKAYRKAIKGEK